MNKKIKKLMNAYEKGMKFDNQFSSLSEKLDLIPDESSKVEFITIKRRLVPAYVMTLILISLITGLVGLQLGINFSYKDDRPYQDTITSKLDEMVDAYIATAVHTSVFENGDQIAFYVGILEGKEVLIVNNKVSTSTYQLNLDVNNQNFNIISPEVWTIIDISDFEPTSIIIQANLSIDDSTNYINNTQLNLSSYYQYLYTMQS